MVDGLNVGIAFLAGLLSFASPCVIVIVPIFLSNVAGVRIDQANLPETKRQIQRATWLFIIGFTVVFTIFGALSGLVAQQFVTFRDYFNLVAGILIIFFGMTMLDVFKLNFLQRTLRLPVEKTERVRSNWHPLLMGVAFAAGWTPCVGPILAAILLQAGSTASVGLGTFYLLIYSLGLMLPFILVGYFLQSSQKLIYKINPYLGIIKWASGLIVILLGILLISGDLGRVVSYFYFLKPPAM